MVPSAPVAPVLDPSIPQYFAPGDGDRWTPALVGAARLNYTDSKLGIDESRDVVITTPIVDGPVPVDWEHGEPADFDVRALQKHPPHVAVFDSLPSAAATSRKYAQWSKDFSGWLAQSQAIELFKNARTKVVSHPDERERDFRIRLQTTVREQRDAEMAKVREKYASRLSTAGDKVRRAESAVQKQQEQASESKLQTGVSVAATIFGALIGRSAMSASTLGRATTAARSVSRIGRESQDVARAEADLGAVKQKHDELTEALNEELQQIADRWDTSGDTLDRVVVKPKRGSVAVQLVALVWLPR